MKRSLKNEMTQKETNIVLGCLYRYIVDRKYRVVYVARDGSDTFMYHETHPKELMLKSLINKKEVLTLAKNKKSISSVNNTFCSNYRRLESVVDEDKDSIYVSLVSKCPHSQFEDIKVGKFVLLKKNKIAKYKKSLSFENIDDYLIDYIKLNSLDEKTLSNPFKHIDSITSHFFLFLIFGCIDDDLYLYGFDDVSVDYMPFGIQKPNSAGLFYQLQSDGTYPKPKKAWPHISNDSYYELTNRGSIRRINPHLQFRKFKKDYLQYLKSQKGIPSDYYETIKLISSFNSTEILYLLSKFYDVSNTSGNSLKPGHFKMISSKLALKTLCL